MKPINLYFVNKEIKIRSRNAKKLAKKFPELKGLSYTEFINKLPMELDFITSNELYEFLNNL